MTWVNFQTVRENLDVSAVLSHYGFDVKPNGQDQVKICCPFHDDHKPSCGLNLKKGVFNCFSCQAKGNILDFVARMEGFDPDQPRELRKAAVLACELFKIDGGSKDVPAGDQPKAKARGTQTGKRPKRTDTAAGGRAGPTPSSKAETTSQGANLGSEADVINPPLTFELKLEPEHSFLSDRRITKELVQEFGLGFAKRGSMAGRICFPVHNEEGDLIAYAGRLASDDQDDDKPRYLLPKGFEKSCVLYNLNRVIAKREQLIVQGEDVGDAVVIVEGYWSVLRLHAVSVPVVASFGASLSPQQVSLLVQAGFRNAVLIFDGDEGGRKGSEQALPVLATRLFAKTVSLEDGVKPDEMSDEIVAELPRYVR
ncbi:CHC2 zinc finger domain-containing protein [Yoonia sp. GPGPB17]|uniref:CHC2 zinc finger domain-containing protein n=1 Tax=Yoonia sp. GPGPB17 TaxID=3026147 RepID=UPI0030C00AAC